MGASWTCPECGHGFVTRNAWHSCSTYSLDHHFADSSAEVREAFERLVEIAASCGPVRVIPQKTRIALQAEVRFASCVTRRRWAIVGLWLTRPVGHRLLQRVEKLGPRAHYHHFRIRGSVDFDEALVDFVRESYQVGIRRHLGR